MISLRLSSEHAAGFRLDKTSLCSSSVTSAIRRPCRGQPERSRSLCGRARWRFAFGTRARSFTGPAIEYNIFPYSQYTRRQLRIAAAGPYTLGT